MDRPPGGSRGRGKLGGLAGQRITIHRKKFHFCIIQTILNKINKKKILKSLDLANFVNFADFPQGGGLGGTTPTPYWRTLFIRMVKRIQRRPPPGIYQNASGKNLLSFFPDIRYPGGGRGKAKLYTSSSG